MKLENKVAIVTGGGQGIGRGIVHCLAEEGADVSIIDIYRESAEKVAAEIRELGRRSLAVIADVTQWNQVKRAVQEVVDSFGKIDILVNNVGGTSKAALAGSSIKFEDMDEAVWDDEFRLNLKTQGLMCQAVVPHFKKQKSGKIVNIASMVGKVGNPDELIAYGAAKAGVINLTKSLALILGKDNVNANCICPGLIYTSNNMVRFLEHYLKLAPEVGEITPREHFLKWAAQAPLRREQTPEDIGHAVVFLASEDAKNITGQALHVDGGLVMY